MAFVNIEDMYGQSAELIIFPNLYKKANTILEKDRPIISFGALSDKDGEPKILSDVIYELKMESAKETISKLKSEIPEIRKKNESRQKFMKKNVQKPMERIEKPVVDEQKILNIRIPKTASPEKIKELKKILDSNKGGEYKVCFTINEKKIETKFCINLNKDLAEKIKSMLNE